MDNKKKELKSYDLEFKLKVLKECSEVGNTTLVARRYKLSPSTVHTWKKTLEDKDTKLKDQSIKSLKKELSDKDLENQILKELLKKTYQVWSKN
jgi:transposase-like protein